MFSELCKDMDADAVRLLYHAEVRWLSRGKILKRVFQLRQKLCVFLDQHKHPMAINFQNNFWLAKLSYLCSIFEKTNQLNLSLQGNGSDVFEAGSKIEAFKQKLKLWQRKVSICDFLDFKSLNNFMQTCKWEIKTTNLESTITSTVHEHLEVLQQNFGVYISEDNYLSMNSLLWIVQPFTNEDFDLVLTNKFIELRSDLVKKAEFKTFTNYTDFWVSLLSNFEYQTLAQKAIFILVRMPST